MDDRDKQLLALGREHYEKRDYEKAEGYLRKLLERDHQFADVYNMLGVVHHDRGRFDDAQRSFEEALRINPNYTEAALNLAVTYNDLGRYSEAKRIYSAALQRGKHSEGEIDPFVRGKIANLHADVARAYNDAGLLVEATHELQKAVLLCPDFADLRLRLANVFRARGDLEAARYELEEAVKARPGYVPAHVALGVVALSLGKKDEAMVHWREAAERDPENKTAQMYLRMGEAGEDGPLSSFPPPPQEDEQEGISLAPEVNRDAETESS